MVTTVGGVAIEIRGDNSSFNRTMREAQRDAQRTGQIIERDFRKADVAVANLNNTLKGTASSMLALTAAFGVGAGLAGGVRIIANFSQAMATLQAISGATAEEMAALEAQARLFGSTTKFSATQAADAMTELARVGFSVNEVMAAIGPTLSAAIAGGAEIATTAEIIGSSIRGFGLEATDAARVADVLAQAANASNAGIVDLGEAMKFAAPTAKQLGLGLEETVAIIGKLSDGGLKGGLAGRGFQSLATQIVNNQDKIEDLIGTYDLAEEGLGSILSRLKQAGITTAQIIEIFRAENLDTFGILADAAVNGQLDKLTGQLDDAAGSSAKVAAVMADNLNGAIQGAASAFEELNIALGKAGAEQAIINAVRGLTQLLVLAAKNADVLAVSVVALTARALIPLAISVVPAAVGALRNLAGSLLFVQGAAARAAIATNFLGGPLTLAIAGAAAAYLVLARDAQKAQDRIDRANAALDTAKQVLGDTQGLLTGGNSPFEQIADQAGAAVTEVASLAGAIDGLATGLKNLREEGQIATALRLGEALAGVDASIAELEQARDKFVNKRTFSAPVALKDAARAEALGKFGDTEEGQQLLFLTQQRAALQNRLGVATQGLGINDLINQFRNGSPDAPTTTTTKTGEGPIELTKAELRAAQDELDTLLDSAQQLFDNIQGRRNAASQQRIDEFRLNQAQQDAAARAGAQQRYDEFLLNKAAEDKLRARISDTLAQGLEDGIRSGNWGEAFRGILAQSTSEALSKAINDLASELVSILGKALGSGGFSGFDLASIFDGNRVAGGPVKAGMRYMVGENGPEMFVPTVPGVILPKSEFPASAALGGVGGGGIVVNAPFIVQGSVTEEVLPKMQAMMAAQAKELPRIVDARVSDSLRRGRY